MNSISIEILDSGFIYRKIEEIYGKEKQTQKAFSTKQELIEFLGKEL